VRCSARPRRESDLASSYGVLAHKMALMLDVIKEREED
jgi:hypothetical protein